MINSLRAKAFSYSRLHPNASKCGRVQRRALIPVGPLPLPPSSPHPPHALAILFWKKCQDASGLTGWVESVSRKARWLSALLTNLSASQAIMDSGVTQMECPAPSSAPDLGGPSAPLRLSFLTSKNSWPFRVAGLGTGTRPIPFGRADTTCWAAALPWWQKLRAEPWEGARGPRWVGRWGRHREEQF